jgi:hypothetical protein
LLPAAKQEERRRAQGDMSFHGDGDGNIASGNLFNSKTIGKEVGPSPPVLLGERQTQQAQRPYLPYKFIRELPGRIQFLRNRFDFLLGELSTGIANS